jgi:hypothetical protein
MPTYSQILASELEFKAWIRLRRNVAGVLRQRRSRHQSVQEASLLSRLAATQWTRVQRLSPENIYTI